MTRVMVIGNAGGGKSRLSRRICAARDLPYISLDLLMWKPGWVRVPDAEVIAQHEALLAQKTWLIDGWGPQETVQRRLEICDAVIFVDLPVYLHFWWATKRQVASLFVARPDWPEDCPIWKVTMPLYRMMWGAHKSARPALVKAIYAQSPRVKTVHLKSRAALNAFASNPVL